MNEIRSATYAIYSSHLNIFRLI